MTIEEAISRLEDHTQYYVPITTTALFEADYVLRKMRQSPHRGILGGAGAEDK